MTKNLDFPVGTKLRWSGSLPDGSTYTYTVRVVRDVPEQAAVWIQFPERVRTIPFAPNGGKRFGLYRVADLLKASC